MMEISTTEEMKFWKDIISVMVGMDPKVQQDRRGLLDQEVEEELWLQDLS